LREIGTTYTGLSGKSKSDFGHGAAKFITYMNVFSNPITSPEAVEPIEVDDRQNEVQEGDVFFTTSSETPEEVGMSSVLLKNQGKTYLNSFCFGYRPTEKIDGNYLAYMLRSDNVRNKIIFLAQGISRYNISKNKMMEIAIPLPNYKEQEKIGLYFRQLDNLITLHQRKLDNLVNIKKSLLLKMFPQDGQDKPEIRFAGFTDAWEQRKLKDVSEIITGGTPSTSVEKYWSPKSIPWLSSGEVHKKRISYTDNMISKDGLNNSSAKWIPNFSILIALAGQGKTRGTVAINTIPITTNQSIAAISLNGNFDSEFIFQNLEMRYKEIREMSSGAGARGGLNKQIVGNINVPWTDKKEQKLIGDCLKKIDNLITLHQRELEKLQNLKKSLLEKMFV
jgi:type I restriction enzyme S subunit